jgi:hypothetical protein
MALSKAVHVGLAVGLSLFSSCQPAKQVQRPSTVQPSTVQPNKVQMSEVLAICDGGPDFSAYVGCIKRTYDNRGTQPGSIAIRSFYAQLDALAEQSGKNQISNAEAKAAAYRTYDATIGASNRANRLSVCIPTAVGVICD